MPNKTFMHMFFRHKSARFFTSLVVAIASGPIISIIYKLTGVIYANYGDISSTFFKICLVASLIPVLFITFADDETVSVVGACGAVIVGGVLAYFNNPSNGLAPILTTYTASLTTGLVYALMLGLAVLWLPVGWFIVRASLPKSTPLRASKETKK